jgi:hypothetical protein
MRRAVVIGGAVLVVLAAAGVWISVRALHARAELRQARVAIAAVKADLVAGRSATADLQAAQSHAARGRAATHDVVWAAASWLPPVDTMRGLTTVADDLTHRALPPLVQVGASLRPSALRVRRDTLALQPLHRAAPELEQANRVLTAATRTVRALPGGWFGPIGSARRDFLRALTGLGGSVDAAARFARVGPPMLGIDGPRRYFVAVQNNAEARGTGGLVGAYALLVADHGKLTVVRRGSDQDFRTPNLPVVNLGHEFDDVYGGYDATSFWPSSNLSPHFPDAADIWAHLWEHQSGQHIDGVIGIDPVALAGVLRVTGPTTVAGYGQPLTADNLVDLTLSKEYSLFTNNFLRRQFLDKVASAVLDKLLSGAGDASALATALGTQAGGGHLGLWSANPAEQAVLAPTPLAGELPTDRRPFASVTVDNSAGGKLDYYLGRSLRYSATTCEGSRRPAQITVSLRNGAPASGLPAYVLAGTDVVSGARGTARDGLIVLVHATAGALLSRATVDGHAVDVSPGTERGHAVFSLDLTINPGQTRVIRLSLDEPVLPGAPQTKVQPLATGQRTALDVPSC